MSPLITDADSINSIYILLCLVGSVAQWFERAMHKI